MIVAIASGKGGTGKTTIATNLARVASETGERVRYIDCDVEEPNGHIFLRPEIAKREHATVEIPHVDAAKCTACGACGAICQYSAILCLGGQVLVFDRLCHSCGGCRQVCPVGAITPEPMRIGEIDIGKAGRVDFVSGRLRIGHVMTPALIRKVKTHIDPAGLTILDVPPGTSCPVVASLRGADYVLLVTEPTPFGLYDLKLAVELVRELCLPFGVVINRHGIGNDAVERYCQDESIDVLLHLADDRRIAEAYSSGKMIADELPGIRRQFHGLLTHLDRMRARQHAPR